MATYVNGTAGNDVLRGVGEASVVRGFGERDALIEGGVQGQSGRDIFEGGDGDDRIFTRWGRDMAAGGAGDDVILSRSDAGEPEIAQDSSLAKIYGDEPLADSKDSSTGGAGADTFYFGLDLDARPDILAKHADASGTIDWQGVTGENDAAHLHWVESIGINTITDFSRDEGDKIVLEGHTVTADIAHTDTNGDGIDDMSVITLRSDQGGAGSHDRDVLGTIKVMGDLVEHSDLMIDDMSVRGTMGSLDDLVNWTNTTATGHGDVLRSEAAGASLDGRAGNDTIIDGGDKGDTDRDGFKGGSGDDVIRTRWGDDRLMGGDGNDILVSRSDAGEPNIAQDPNAPKYAPGEPLPVANDKLTGGAGCDTFFFRFDLNATAEIIERHTGDDGDIDWAGVTGENGAPHLHWVEGIGTDTIMDFRRDEGDIIAIEGHTVEVYDIQHIDKNKDGVVEYSMLLLRSNQGGAGAHDQDLLGRIKVYGDAVNMDDICIDNMVTHGVADRIDDFAIL